MTLQTGLQTIAIHIIPMPHKVNTTRQWNLAN